MTTAAPTFSQIKAQVTAIRDKLPKARVIGIHSSARWSGEPMQRDGNHAYAIYQCDSPLAMRFALREPTNDNTTKVLITAIDEKDLSDDILLRLAKRQLFPIKPWQIVRTLFNANAIDPRLSAHPWIAEMLLELIPAGGYPPARAGFLDAETAWPLLLRQAIGLGDEAPDLTSLLKWAQDAQRITQFQRASEEFRIGAIAWLAEKAGPAAEVLLRSVQQMERPDAVPVGLAAGVVYHLSATGKLDKATGKLEERYLGKQSPTAELMQRWSTAATEVVRTLRHTDPKQYRQLLNWADEILREVQADSFAYLSDTSDLGFDQRMARFGNCLSGLIINCPLEREAADRGRNAGAELIPGRERNKTRRWEVTDDLQAAFRAIRDHDKTSRETVRLERVEMALRLIRWLAGRANTSTSPRSLAEAAIDHLREGGFVDWARLSLWRGEPVGELSAAYSRLFDEVRTIREQQAKMFARLLADWTAAGSKCDEVLPAEQILEKVVAPLAADRLVLVIVVDGMSVAVCRELMRDIAGHEWVPICEQGREFNRPGLATIPSVTEFARTSLLCGQLQQGHAANEVTGFAEHPALLAQSRSGSPPILFHKAGLQETDDTSLAKEVRAAIQSTHRRVVGVVINAVDDHLLKGEQIDVRWSRDQIKVLPALLHEARVARRLVVLVSDHGHVLDCQSQARTGDAGERYRTAAGEPADDELVVQGRRVLTEGHRIIVPWSERIRYGIKKNGYHGGLTPQEMVVPIVVLSSTDDFPEGWREQPIDTPVWWDEIAKPALEQRPAVQLKPVEPKTSKPTGTLFDLESETVVVPSETVATIQPTEVSSVRPEWVSRLLLCEVYEDQKRLGGRNLPTDDVFGQLLTELDQRGGKLRSAALARALQFPPMRLPGLLAKAERVLNVDGYDILRWDETSDTVELNRELLLKQFDLIV